MGHPELREATASDVAFLVEGGGPYTLAEMLTANADSPDVCAWVQAARPGDVLRDLVECRCVATAPR